MRAVYRGIALGIGLIAVLALTGCAPPVVTPTAISTAAPPVTTTPTATPTQAALADLLVSPEGIGPLHVSEPVPPQSGPTAVVNWNADVCSAADPEAYRGAWLPNYPKTGDVEISNPDGAVFTFESERKDSPITFIAVWSRELKTAKGIGIGSTAGQLTATYGSDLTVKHGQLSDVYYVQGNLGTLVLEIPTQLDPNLNAWSAAELGSVVWMYVFAGHDTAFSLEGNQQAGSCFVPE